MKDEPLLKPIFIINRHNGKIERTLNTKKEYVSMYGLMCNMNDIAIAIKVWCDFTNQTKKELLRQFSLIELVNTFSTRYIAQVSKPRKGKK